MVLDSPLMRKLADYETPLRKVLTLMMKARSFHCSPSLSEIFAENSRLIVAMSHGTPLGWLPSVALLGVEALESGGKARIPMGVMDNFFFHVPLIRDLAQWITQTERPVSFADLSERFLNRGDIDLIIFPEGSNCFFGPPDEIQDFRSSRFVELSIVSGAPILICAHRGSENWSLTVPVSKDSVGKLDFLPDGVRGFLEKRLLKTGLLTLPLWPAPIERFEMRCELYRPQLTAVNLSSEPEMRRQQISEESQRVHEKMCQLRDQFFLIS